MSKWRQIVLSSYKFLAVMGILVPSVVLGQARFITASKVGSGQITIDGVLDEYCWTHATPEVIGADRVFVGTVDDDADCCGDFVALWSDQGLYIGTHFNDDIHNAINSQYRDAANIAYDDDGIQYVLNNDFDAAIALGARNWSPVRGFGNLDPTQQNCGWWGPDDGSGKGWSTGMAAPEEARAMGWDEVFTSQDGLSYTSECLFTWAGIFMENVGSKNEGQGIAFGMFLTDNDGGFTSEGYLSWTGLRAPGPNNEGWGKIILGATAGISPTSTVKPASQVRTNRTFDLLGRRISPISNRSPANVIVFTMNKNGKTVRQLAR